MNLVCHINPASMASKWAMKWRPKTACRVDRVGTGGVPARVASTALVHLVMLMSQTNGAAEDRRH